MNIDIDFGQVASEGRLCLTKQKSGRGAREELCLDALDATNLTITLWIPETLIAISSGYMIGLIGQSIETLGKEVFLERYKFEGPDFSHIVDRTIRDYSRFSS